MPATIGFEPEGGSSGQSYSHPTRITADLIRCLPLLTSYKPSDRQHMKKCIIKMLKSIGCVWVLENVLHNIERHHHITSAQSPLGGVRRRQLFSPGPTRPQTSIDFGYETSIGAKALTHTPPHKALTHTPLHKNIYAGLGQVADPYAHTTHYGHNLSLIHI